MAFELTAIAWWGIAGSDRHGDRRPLQSQPLGLEGDAAQRRLQVAFDVDRQRLQRRDVEDAAPLGFCGHRLVRQLVDAPEERRQRLATAGWSGHERMLAAGD